MKSLYTLITIVTVIFYSSVNTYAEKKNPPKNDDTVENALKSAGDDHYPEKFKFDDIGSVDHEDTYYHVYVGYDPSGNYRIIFFDNTPAYLGYYLSEYEPIDYEESAIILDDGDSGLPLRIGKNGPSDKTLIDGVPVSFVKNKNFNKVNKKIVTEVKSKPKIAYRKWLLRGKEYECIFVKRVGSKIFLKEKQRGKTMPFSERDLSKDDLDYLRELEVL